MMDRRDFIKTSGMVGAALPFTSVNSLAKPVKSTDVHICVFSKHLQWLDYQDTARVIRDIGFDGPDLTVRPGGHVVPEQVESQLPQAVSDFESMGLKVKMMTSSISKADEDSQKVLEVAGDLGIAHYRMGYLGYVDELSIPENLEKHSERLQKLGELNEKFGLTGSYQNHSGTRVGGPVWDLWYMMRDLEPSLIGVQYDVRHATVEGGYSWSRGMELVKPWIQNLVIKDFVWKQKDNGKWKAVSVPLGTGMVDFEKYFRLLKEWNITGPFSVHYEYPILSKEEWGLDKTEKMKRAVANMSKDLTTLKNWLREYGIAK